jgi:hypothetical protein
MRADNLTKRAHIVPEAQLPQEARRETAGWDA